MTDVAKTTSNRIDTIDVAKGIGILLVVFAHVNLSPPAIVVIYAFHMPLFFILAGMMFNNEKYSSAKALLKNKFRTMILPYCFFCMLGVLYKSVFLVYSHNWTGIVELTGKAVYSIVWAPYSLKYFRDFNTPMWFVPSLMLVEIIYYLLLRSCKRKSSVIIAAASISTVGWIMESGMIPIDFSVLPWNLSSACFSLGFFTIGNLCFPLIKKELIERPASCKKTRVCTALLALSCAITIFAGLANGKVSIGSRILNNGLLLYISGCAGTVFVLVLSEILRKSRTLGFCGKNSFSIMGSHILIYWFLSWCISVVAKRTSPNLNMFFSSEIGKDILFVAVLLLTVLFVTVYNYCKTNVIIRRKHGRTA